MERVDLDGQLWLERVGGPPSWMDGHPWGFPFDAACDGKQRFDGERFDWP